MQPDEITSDEHEQGAPEHDLTPTQPVPEAQVAEGVTDEADLPVPPTTTPIDDDEEDPLGDQAL